MLEETKKMLEIKMSPLNGYMEDAYPLTVAITRESNYEWIYSNYIQLVFQDPYIYRGQPVKFYKVSFKNGRVWDAELPLLCYDTITRDMVEVMEMDIIELICTAISRDYYVKVYLDEYFLPYRWTYKKQHYTHESLFFGFDNEKKELYGLAYVTDKDGYHFKKFAVSMEDVKEAYYSQIEKGVLSERIAFMSCNPERFYEFDKETVKRGIYEYLNSIGTDKKYSSINNPDDKYTFGIGIYDLLMDYYKGGVKNKLVIPLHIIYEHKKLMLDRILYMIDNHYLRHDQSIINGFYELAEKANTCKFLFLRYSANESEKAFRKMEKAINEVKRLDIELMKKLYVLMDDDVEEEHKEYIYSRCGLWRDVAFYIGEKTYNFFKITFKLHIINDRSKGYIRVTNNECLNNYYAPFMLKLDAENNEFGIADSFDIDYTRLEGIQCEKGHDYTVKYYVNLDKRRYKVDISDNEHHVVYENTYIEEVAEKLKYINYMAMIHNNSYRFAVSEID
ncbi:MAG: hypothetical protein K6C35_05990 [Eubacterium sp.]|nr:hypothetical protein [Eubacterium sp.]